MLRSNLNTHRNGLIMKRVTIGILSGVALATGEIVLGFENPASAAVIWDWRYSGVNVFDGSGTFTTDDQAPDGSFLITGITGTSEGQPITALLPPGSGSNDNLLSPGFPQLTQFGFSYATLPPQMIPPPLYNLFYISGQYFLDPLVNDFLDPRVIDFEAIARVIPPPATVPEPGSLIGYITLGGLVLGSAVRKARHSSP